ncbi:TIR domain-containing protein [Burkholderia cepacia]|nr:TIR domain-containing protein [Burkholderia cepacia]
MTGKAKKEFRIFFSWQSDLPDATNTKAIRTALQGAVKSLKSVYPDLTIVLDEATRDTSGSPNIARKIFEKIERSDMLVCDITTIDRQATRPCPNPNVLYELGYAMALLGEDRIVMLFNEAHGTVKTDLPFDIVQNRVSPYTMTEPVTPESSSQLASLAKVAIRAVIVKDPKTPVQLRGLDPEKIKYEHDVENLKWLMSMVHIPTIDEHIQQVPKCIADEAAWFADGFDAVVTSSRFSLYDAALDASVRAFHRAWETTLRYDRYYHEAGGGRVRIFTNPGDLPLSGAKERAWETIDAARQDMARAFQEMLSKLRSDYVTVEVSKRSDEAWASYLSHRREVKALMAADGAG